MTTPLADELRRLAALGHTAMEAAALAGCSPGVARTTASRGGFRFTLESERQAARIVELARAGCTAAEIATDVGICRHNIYRKLARLPDAPRPATKTQRAREAAQRAKEAEEAARMERWREAWARKKAARREPPAPTRTAPLDEAALGAAMRQLAASERNRKSA